MFKALHKLMEKQEAMFTGDSKLAKLYPLFEAKYSFLFGTKETAKTSPHVRDNLDTKRFMIIVVLALLPATLFGIYNAGLQAHLAAGLSTNLLSVFLRGLQLVLPIILVSYIVGGIWEVLFAIFRKHEINEGFLVTGLLFPLTLPPTIPLWQVALGITFGVVVGKEVFGGTGRNFLNPALTARAFVYFAFPAQLSGEVWTALLAAKDQLVDGYSGATPLGVAALAKAPEVVSETLRSMGYSMQQFFLGFHAGSIGETSTLAILIGAAILIITGVGSWRTMVGALLGLVGMTFILNIFAGPSLHPFMALNPAWHIIIGSFAFGAVFMATDPVSSPDLKTSKWIYGVLIGALTVIIRVANPAYPEGVMLAILLMNVFAPLIDHFVMKHLTKKRVKHVLL